MLTALPVVAPLCAIVAVTVFALVHLTVQDRQLPVFDVGALTILITGIYSAAPLLGFWLAGLHWTPLSYLPLYTLNPGPEEVGSFAWRHVVYLSALAAAYLTARGSAVVPCAPIRRLNTSAVTALMLIGCGLLVYFRVLQLAFGVTYDPSYSDLAETTASLEALPLLARQASHNLFAILFLVKIALLIWIVGRWQDRRWRALLFVWLVIEGATTISRMGGRTWYVMLLMATGLLYHRLVKPLPIVRAAAFVLLVFGGVVFYGVARDVGGGLKAVAAAEESPWATMNEFQALFGMAYDLHARREAGTLGAIPWQIYANDGLMLVPSQLLPFPKNDPCVGYPAVDGVGVGCVLGVISSAVVGFDHVELVVRGIVLGILFGMLHRWYARRPAGYWATFFYLCMCLWCYYTFRGSTFYFLYDIVYRFVPLIVTVRVLQEMLRYSDRLVATPADA